MLTLRFTALPAGAWSPPGGWLEITLPSGTEDDLAVLIFPTEQLPWMIAVSAATSDLPATFGTLHPGIGYLAAVSANRAPKSASDCYESR